jgi:hypothetical protein
MKYYTIFTAEAPQPPASRLCSRSVRVLLTPQTPLRGKDRPNPPEDGCNESPCGSCMAAAASRSATWAKRDPPSRFAGPTRPAELQPVQSQAYAEIYRYSVLNLYADIQIGMI